MLPVLAPASAGAFVLRSLGRHLTAASYEVLQRRARHAHAAAQIHGRDATGSDVSSHAARVLFDQVGNLRDGQQVERVPMRGTVGGNDRRHVGGLTDHDCPLQTCRCVPTSPHACGCHVMSSCVSSCAPKGIFRKQRHVLSITRRWRGRPSPPPPEAHSTRRCRRRNNRPDAIRFPWTGSHGRKRPTTAAFTFTRSTGGGGKGCRPVGHAADACTNGACWTRGCCTSLMADRGNDVRRFLTYTQQVHRNMKGAR